MFTNESVFQLVGHITILFATWDCFVSLLIVRLLKRGVALPKDFEGWTLTAKLRFLEELAERKVIDVGVLAAVKAVIPDAIKVAKRRNRFIHQLWELAPDSLATGEVRLLAMKVVMTSAGRTVNFDEERVKLLELKSFFDSLGQQQVRFATLLEKLPLTN